MKIVLSHKASYDDGDVTLEVDSNDTDAVLIKIGELSANINIDEFIQSIELIKKLQEISGGKKD